MKDTSYFESDEYRKKMAEAERETAALMQQAAQRLPKDQERCALSYGIPERAVKVILSGEVIDTEAWKAAKGALDMLVLSGAPGCGKTIAAALWATEDLRDVSKWKYSDCVGGVFGQCGNDLQAKSSLWITAAKLSRWDRYEEDSMRRLLRAHRLVIDDLGGEYLDKGGFYASLLDELINERQAGSRPTVMTTNLDAAAFTARYGERIADRIREGGRFFACGNKSLRRKSAA